MQLDEIEKKYFADLLVEGRLSRLDDCHELFDFSDVNTKRKAFNAKRRQLMTVVMKTRGNKCLLRFPDICEETATVLDHFIPLASNKINKDIKQLKPAPGRKVASKSYGSNHPKNLIPSCVKCNAYKKHRLPTKSQAKSIVFRPSDH